MPQRNRPASFDAALTAYIPGLRNFAKRRVAGDKVDELVQDTLTNALTNWQSYRTEDGTFATWLRWQMRSVLSRDKQKARRKKRTAKEVEYDKVSVAAPRQLVTQPSQENIVVAAQAVRRLSRSKGGRMLLRLAKGETLMEVGGRRKLSGQRVQQLAAGAREKLRAAMGEVA